MTTGHSFLRTVLLINGAVDLACALALLALPLVPVPLLGYQLFDAQGVKLAREAAQE